MNKEHIVRDNRDFSIIIKEGKYVKNNNLVIYMRDSGNLTYRFGFSVGKKLGNAVKRNKLKRQMRNIVYKYKKSYQNGRDYIIMVRNSCVLLSFQELEASYVELLNRTLPIGNKEKLNEEIK